MRKKCPICHRSMRRRGSIKVGPRGGKRFVHYCAECGYQSL